jgi:cbb3-type cytochrome oxidase subunit 3
MVEQKTNELRKTRLYMVISIISMLLVIIIVVYIAQRREKQHAIAAANYQATIKELSLDDILISSPLAT